MGGFMVEGCVWCVWWSCWVAPQILIRTRESGLLQHLIPAGALHPRNTHTHTCARTADDNDSMSLSNQHLQQIMLFDRNGRPATRLCELTALYFCILDLLYMLYEIFYSFLLASDTLKDGHIDLIYKNIQILLLHTKEHKRHRSPFI